MTNETRYPRPFVVYAFALLASGLVVAARAWSVDPPIWSIQLVLIAGAVLLSEEYALRLGTFSISLTLPLIVAALVVDGGSAAMAVSALSFTNYKELREGRPLSAHALNLGQGLIAAAMAGLVYGQLDGPTVMSGTISTPLAAPQVPWAIFCCLVAASAFAVTNSVLVALALQLGRDIPMLAVLRDMAQNLPTQLALTLVGLLMAQVLAMSPLAFPLFLFPLLLARQTYQRYAELRDAYLDTVRSLIGALEAKDPYTRGHSERVADYVVGLARHRGLDDAHCERLERAALLHDIGKLALSGSLLTKPTGLTAVEAGVVRDHPKVGAAMIGRIPPLRSLADSVGAHHERVDGTGYPAGLHGDEIPLDARMLAIADAYDAMTTNRSYRSALSREAALAELMAGAGTQFDRALVMAFIESDGCVGHVGSFDASPSSGAAIPVSRGESAS